MRFTYQFVTFGSFSALTVVGTAGWLLWPPLANRPCCFAAAYGYPAVFSVLQFPPRPRAIRAIGCAAAATQHGPGSGAGLAEGLEATADGALPRLPLLPECRAIEGSLWLMTTFFPIHVQLFVQ